ncbi:helix-turn-helix domain-containing protein [Ruminococcus flavefaciens]|uniref:helix-turn-helix domain-containing protein n=1 Tax=Ruminococcus flavefaciens TaxID=1265 RepID=UPI0026EC1477|nr:helix-turn-helix transcriptional regulator [Ruminococcus flavefaciens]MDD7515118.1 helix-turn-helix transcriptional regulator [Ruminococcus flavefaciens]MDY5692615.1 helix-turn-helix transcriptional regulator [Ruminococcus flavefaciens]
MEFNNKLYELRKQKGFSQEELANRLNVSRQTVSKWEVGDSTPDMEKLIAISDLFGISLDELVLDKTSEPSSAAQSAKPDIYSEIKTDIKEKVLTDSNRKKAKKGLKIAGIILGAILAIDIISFVIYVVLNGFPK